jgi:hypothetical protein
MAHGVLHCGGTQTAQAGAQLSVLHAKWDAAGQIASAGEDMRTGEVCIAALIRDGPAHRPGSSARHVHLVVKAMRERSVRLNIRKATLREWRHDFAQYLRDLGVEANAMERAVRGEARSAKLDGIHRAAMRGASTHYRNKAEAVVQELAHGGLKAEPSRVRYGRGDRDSAGGG